MILVTNSVQEFTFKDQKFSYFSYRSNQKFYDTLPDESVFHLLLNTKEDVVHTYNGILLGHKKNNESMPCAAK